MNLTSPLIPNLPKYSWLSWQRSALILSWKRKTAFKAYISEELFDEKAFKMLMENYAARIPLSYGLKKIKRQN
ncbi:MAG: hypothetical protein LRY55_06045, partial [Leadbetterella sp.]|nr:hypothetical protein [Leadbetterella sp.]